MNIWIVIVTAIASLVCINVGRIWRASENIKKQNDARYQNPHAKTITIIRYIGFALLLIAFILLIISN